MNGQDRAEQNFQAFKAWAATKSDADYREMVTKGQLSRAEICRECGFGRSALVQNPRIKDALYTLEESLRSRGVLPLKTQSDVTPLRQKGQLQAATDAERLRKLEAEVAGLRAEKTELQRRLRRFESIQALLAETGRLPR